MPALVEVLFARVSAFVHLPEGPDKLSPGSPVGIFCPRNIPVVPITLGTGTLHVVRTGPAEADSRAPCSWSPGEASQRLALSSWPPVSDAQTHPAPRDLVGTEHALLSLTGLVSTQAAGLTPRTSPGGLEGA